MPDIAGLQLQQSQNPHKYEETYFCVARDTAEFIPKLLKIMSSALEGAHTGEEKLYLDYGCGSGSTAAKYMIWPAQLTNSRIIGVDVSEDMIKYATEYYKHPKLQFIHGDILSDTDWPLKNVLFDGIFAIYSLHLMKDYKKALQRLYNQLKVNGKIGIMIPEKFEFFCMMKRLKDDPNWSNYAKHIYYPDYTTTSASAMETYLTTMEYIGFKILKMKSYQRSDVYGNIKQLAEFYISMNPFAESLSLDLKQQLLEWYLKDLSSWPILSFISSAVRNGARGNVVKDLDDFPVYMEYNTIIIIAQK